MTVQGVKGVSRKRRSVIARTLMYVVLAGVAVLMLFPFIYMATSAIKIPADTFRYPPKILPREPETLTIDGEELPLYSLPVAGGERTVVLKEQGIDAGLFRDPTDPEISVAWPLALAEATGRTTQIAGVEVELFLVPIDGEPRELALERETTVGRFTDPDDSSIETYAVVRTAPPAERVTARWSNFSEVINLANVDRALTNTILVTILIVAGQLFTSIMGGYAFARIRFPGREPLFLAYLGSIMIPFIVIVVPLFQLMVALDWVNHLSSLVWPFFYTAYGTFLMRQFFLTIPSDLEEAALIDGARRWRILWRIFVPLSWPAIATLATFSFLYAWNSFIWPLVAINQGNEDDLVLTLALRVLGGQSVDSPNLIYAAIALSVVVPFTVFVFAQRYFVESVATAGLK